MYSNIVLSGEECGNLIAELENANRSSGIICGCCEDGFPIFYANDRMASLLGYDTVEELTDGIGGMVVNTIHPDDLAQVMKDLGDMHEGMTYETAYRMPRKDGTWFWTVDNGKVSKTADGRKVIVSVVRDMTEFVKRQKYLEMQNDISASMLGSIPGGYHRCAAEDGFPFIYTSDRFLEILGWTAEDIETEFDNKFINLVHPDDVKLVEEYKNMVHSTENSGRHRDRIYRLKAKDGYRWVNDSAIYINAGGQSFFQCAISDITPFITEKERSESATKAALQAAESKNEIISSISTMFLQIYELDLTKNRYEEVSTRGEKYGARGSRGTLEELRRIGVEILCGDESRETMSKFLDISTFQERLKDKKSLTEDMKGFNGRWYSANIIPERYDKNGRITHLLYAIRDINESKSKEQRYKDRLIEAAAEAERANSAKTDFLRRMSHDIRTPINGIRGMLEIAERTPDDPQKQAECREKIWKASGFLLDLVNNVLDMNKLESGEIKLEYKPFSLSELEENLHSVSAIQAAEAGVQYIRAGVDTEHPDLVGSEVHLRQITQNIITNAIRYNHEGGSVKVGFREVYSDGETASVEFTCEDTGKGMSEEFQKHAFEPFAQETDKARTAYSGTGLGLSIAKKLVEYMGGTIVLQSRIDVGTKFTVTIPFTIDHDKIPSSFNDDIGEHNIEGVRIMLVEDNEMNMEIAEFLLKEHGAVITKAWNGEEAIELFEKSKPGSFDIILMDIMMPIMSGLEAARHIRRLPRKDAAYIPIIAMTANAFHDDIDRSIAAGMNAHITKPLEINSLVKIIAKYTGR